MIFGNVNLDLMYALPQQTVDDARRDVAAALAFAPPHLSFYQLTLEPNTLFHRHPPPLPDDDAAADIEDAVASRSRTPATCTTRRPRMRGRDRVPSQRQLLALRRLPRHRRGRALQALVCRSHRAPAALEAAAAVPRAGRRGAPLQEDVEVSRGDIRLRVHAERAAPHRRRAARRRSPSAPAFRSRCARGRSPTPTRKGLLEPDPARAAGRRALGRRFLNDLQALFLPDDAS